MKRVQMVFFDAGGGHRSAAMALQKVIEHQGREWQLQLVNLQDIFEPLDIFRKVTGYGVQDMYNISLKKGWTLGSPQLIKALHAVIRFYHTRQVRLLKDFWRANPADLVVSLIPNFNRALYQGLNRSRPGTPFMTVLTDLADFPPHFWIEEKQNQLVVCGTAKAVEQARRAGYPDAKILRTSGMILRPNFYEPVTEDRAAGRRRLGLQPELLTGLVLFGGQGSAAMKLIARKLESARLPVQLIQICGKNEELASALKGREYRMPMHVEGFTQEIPALMHLADFFIGKPGPGSISEALHMQLPVIVERNVWTLPQERYNAEWVREKRLGVVLSSFRSIVEGVEHMLNPQTISVFRANAAKLTNRAVFEIPDMMAGAMGELAASPK
jgi:UDP-N-acetylglucosamine:LPS N-acetylglucosamine transferase